MGTASCPAQLQSGLRFQLFGGAAAASRPPACGQHCCCRARETKFPRLPAVPGAWGPGEGAEGRSPPLVPRSVSSFSCAARLLIVPSRVFSFLSSSAGRSPTLYLFEQHLEPRWPTPHSHLPSSILFSQQLANRTQHLSVTAELQGQGGPIGEVGAPGGRLHRTRCVRTRRKRALGS